MNQQVEFPANEITKAIGSSQLKVLIKISHKSITKTTETSNEIQAFADKGYTVVAIDTDGVPALSIYYENYAAATEKRMAILDRKIKVQSKKGDSKALSELLAEKEKEEFRSFNAPTVITHSLENLDKNFKNIKRDYQNYDFMIIDVPAKVLDSGNYPIKELTNLILRADLVLIPYKLDEQNINTAETIEKIIVSLKENQEAAGNVFKPKIRSLLCFEPSRIKARTKLVESKMTLTDTSTASARSARNHERKNLKELDRKEQMSDMRDTFNGAFGTYQPALKGPMIFRSVYPNQFNKGETIYHLNDANGKIAQAEFNVIVENILDAVLEKETNNNTIKI
ncbi:hypothetical protein AO073_01370 [Pseudomonas syringae ICMP 11293]|uniref:hypothetical protein n=1 Tax=Pseudomonas syringae TaxID=317 RepID=UPI0007309429|nr:hypothetical protein [Pseudomonas syringae]KTB91550.1 hypothetical protein AO073_01370 [Pseudomonas syringae ICMP 11293]